MAFNDLPDTRVILKSLKRPKDLGAGGSHDSWNLCDNLTARWPHEAVAEVKCKSGAALERSVTHGT